MTKIHHNKKLGLTELHGQLIHIISNHCKQFHKAKTFKVKIISTLSSWRKLALAGGVWCWRWCWWGAGAGGWWVGNGIAGNPQPSHQSLYRTIATAPPPPPPPTPTTPRQKLKFLDTDTDNISKLVSSWQSASQDVLLALNLLIVRFFPFLHLSICLFRPLDLK